MKGMRSEHRWEPRPSLLSADHSPYLDSIEKPKLRIQDSWLRPWPRAQISSICGLTAPNSSHTYSNLRLLLYSSEQEDLSSPLLSVQKEKRGVLHISAEPLSSPSTAQVYHLSFLQLMCLLLAHQRAYTIMALITATPRMGGHPLCCTRAFPEKQPYYNPGTQSTGMLSSLPPWPLTLPGAEPPPGASQALQRAQGVQCGSRYVPRDT